MTVEVKAMTLEEYFDETLQVLRNTALAMVEAARLEGEDKYLEVAAENAALRKVLERLTNCGLYTVAEIAREALAINTTSEPKR